MAPGPCPSCGSGSCSTFYEARRAPASTDLCASRPEAVAVPRGDIELAFCSACGFVFNAAFDPSLATHPGFHDEARRFTTYKAFEHRLADQLVARYGLYGKEILEIGCGTGEFLGLLCKLGGNLGVGLDPGYVAAPGELAIAGAAAFGKELFTERVVIEPADLVCARLLLERSPDIARLVGALRRALSRRPDARLFVQLPDLVQTLKHVSFWQIHYEHCSYFSPGTLQRVLSAQGLTVGDMWTGLENQLVMAVARTGKGPGDVYAGKLLEPVAELEQLVARFALQCREKQALWCDILRGIAGAGNRTMIWGSGPRTVSFLSTLAVGNEVGWVVDPDPRRQGTYLPGTGHPIVAPAAVAALRPDVMIVMNAIYTLEIQELLARMGCDPTLLIA